MNFASVCRKFALSLSGGIQRDSFFPMSWRMLSRLGKVTFSLCWWWCFLMNWLRAQVIRYSSRNRLFGKPEIFLSDGRIFFVEDSLFFGSTFWGIADLRSIFLGSTTVLLFFFLICLFLRLLIGKTLSRCSSSNVLVHGEISICFSSIYNKAKFTHCKWRSFSCK